MIALISTETALCWQRAALGRFKVKSRVQGTARHTCVFLTGGNQVNRRRFILFFMFFTSRLGLDRGGLLIARYFVNH